MPNWCRNTLLAVGPEPEVSRFVAFAVTKAGQEETTFTEQFETGVLRRETGWARIEVISRWKPPLEVLVDVSCQFPTFRFAVDWEEPGDGQFGCTSIANGSSEVVHLDGIIHTVVETCCEDYDDDAEEAVMELRWEILRATSHLLFGYGPGRKDNDADALREMFSRQACLFG